MDHSVDFHLLRALRNRYAGQRGFVIGNGPSLRAADLARIQECGDITLASNKIYLIFPQTSWRPTWHLIEDTGVARADGWRLAEHFPERVVFADYLEPHIPAAARYAAFRLLDRAVPPAQPGFSEDFSQGAFCGGTITYTALQFAYWLGLTQVYLLGVDFDYALPELRPSQEFPGYNTYTVGSDRNYFVRDYIKPNEIVVAPDLAASLCAYQAAQAFSSRQQDFAIFNATRGGKLEVFPRVNFDGLFGRVRRTNIPQSNSVRRAADAASDDAPGSLAGPDALMPIQRPVREAWRTHLNQLHEMVDLLEGLLGQSFETIRRFAFLDHRADAQLTTTSPYGCATVDAVEFNGRRCRTLLLHPPACLQYAVPTNASGLVSFAVAMHPDVRCNPNSGPCQFLLRVDGTVLCDVTLDVRDDPGSWRWFSFNLAVPARSGDAHQFEFVTEGVGSIDYRWALWRNPVFIWTEASATPQRANGRSDQRQEQDESRNAS